MVLTEDAVAPHQTPMWECSGHLLAGCYIAKYGLVNASLLPFLRGDISPTFFFTCSSSLPGWSTVELKAQLTAEGAVGGESVLETACIQQQRRCRKKTTQPTN